MSIEMPGFLQKAFGLIGMEWPQADEDLLFAAGDAWSAFAVTLREVEADATAAATRIWTTTTGQTSEAFQRWWADQPQDHLAEDADGADTAAMALQMFGAATITLKSVYLVQLGILAATIIQAIATAFLTFGASLAQIPIVTMIVRAAIQAAVDQIVSAVLF